MVRISGYHRRSRKGRKHYVNPYSQTRRLHRGRKRTLKINRKGTGTYWLKGNKGRFIGRANSKRQTIIGKERIKVLGRDTTNISQELKPARIYGRTKGVTEQKIFR